MLAGFIITAAGLGAVNSTNGILIKPICDEFGFSRGEFTLHRTIITLVGACILPFFSGIIKKIGTKKTLIITSIAISVTTASYAFATSIWQFYVIAFINGLFVNGPSFLTVGILINNWFTDKKGIATGIAYCGAGFGGSMLIPLVSYIESLYSWQTVYLFIGVLLLILLLPVSFFLIKENPQKLNLLPYTSKKAVKRTGQINIMGNGLTLKQAAKKPIFYVLIIIFFLLSIMAGGPNTHTAAYVVDIGYTAAFASVVLSLMMAMHMLGNAFLGGFFDKFGVLWGSVLVGACCIMYPLIILFAKGQTSFYIYSVIYGVASSAFCVCATIFVTNFFGNKDFSAILSMITISTTLGTALSGPIMGLIYDIFGSYTNAWLMLLIFGIIVSMGLAFTYFNYSHKIRKELSK